MQWWGDWWHFKASITLFPGKYKKMFRSISQMRGSNKISRTLNHSTCGPHLIPSSQLSSVHSQDLCFCPPQSLHQEEETKMAPRPFVDKLGNGASLHNWDSWPCFVCFEATVSIISYLFKKRTYSLFLWLKCKPHENRTMHLLVYIQHRAWHRVNAQ